MEKTVEQKAYDYAVYLLSLKLRTEGELREKLRIKNYELEIINEVIRQLKENRYINDQNYAEVYLENLKKYKTFGYFGIKKKLMEKRLPANIVEAVLSDGFSQEEEIKIAKRFLIKQVQEGAPLSRGAPSPDKQKLAQKLKSRGFRGSVIVKLIF